MLSIRYKVFVIFKKIKIEFESINFPIFGFCIVLYIPNAKSYNKW